ncbi:hypothetical protein PaG_04081 [Moesziomyces aphidis]|uniref:Peptidase A1 domain-containing protein n=1 Tax=Moesziomyces aphidis TaxID=84754 RepID=W3VIV0_MOEAP|nr:hypothetical protein PaG_04081 [Moesziomyces aphidis]
MQDFKMLSTNVLSAVPLLLATAWCVGAAPGALRGESGVSVSDIKLGYEHTVARYANWKPDTAKPAGRGRGLFEDFKLAAVSDASANDASAIAVVRKRGTVLPLHAVGGYPKMLGVTYNAEVGMGTPTQLFNLTADTGSMLTWAVLASCKDTDCPGASTKRKYDPAASTTSRVGRKDHEAYGDGEMDLTLYSDVVQLGRIKIDATVGGANKTFERDGKLDHDGLLGLGRKADADPAPVLDSLARERRGFQETIALDLGAQPTLEVGGYNYVKYPKMKRYTVEGDEGWQLEGSSITAKGADKVDAINLLLDTGSSVSMLPASRMDAIMNRAGLKVQRSKDEPIVYSMPCDTKLGVQLVLPDGTQVDVDDSDILMRSNDASTPGCLSLLVGTTNPFVPAVAGTPLLQSLYTVLSRNPSGDWIGLAPL